MNKKQKKEKIKKVKKTYLELRERNLFFKKEEKDTFKRILNLN